MSEHAREGFVSARDVVSRNPVPWIGLAFGIGVLTGVLMGGSIAVPHRTIAVTSAKRQGGGFKSVQHVAVGLVAEDRGHLVPAAGADLFLNRPI